MPVTRSGQTRAREVHHKFDFFSSLILIRTPQAHSARSSPHHVLTLCRSLTPRLSPAHHAPHTHLAPRFGHAPRRPLPLVARAAR
jgi:hypothetical protein